MAKSKVKKPKPKPPENAATVIEIRKEIAARKESYPTGFAPMRVQG